MRSQEQSVTGLARESREAHRTDTFEFGIAVAYTLTKAETRTGSATERVRSNRQREVIIVRGNTRKRDEKHENGLKEEGTMEEKEGMINSREENKKKRNKTNKTYKGSVL
jgi:hypothetical protein